MKQDIDDRTFTQKFDELTAFTRACMESSHVPGVSIGMTIKGEVFTAGLGITSAANPLPVTAETLFQIGSTTKTFTALVVMQLMEQGKLALDDTVRKHLPEFRVSDEATSTGVTIRHLLTHTPGWLGDFFPECGVGDDALARYIAAMRDLPQHTPLGAYYAYNNAALVVAGRVIEAVTGQTYEAAVRELVFEPLGMTNSFFFPQEVMLRRFAVGHWLEGEEAVVASPWPIMRAGNPAGGVTSDAIDQVRYMQFHLGDGAAAQGKRLLQTEALQQMQAPQFPMGDGSHVGLTWSVEEIGGVKIVGHGGTTNGQESDFWLAPDQGLGITVLTNLDQGNKVHKAVREWVYEHYLGIRQELPATMAIPQEELVQYALTFLTSTGDYLKAVPHEGGIMLQHSLANPTEGEPGGGTLAPMRARFTAEDRFLVLDEPFQDALGAFLRKPDGEIGWLRLGGRILARKG